MTRAEPPRSIRIRRLVLDGVDPRQQPEVVAALRAELERLLRAGPGAERPSGGWDGTAAGLGGQIATQVHARLEAP